MTKRPSISFNDHAFNFTRLPMQAACSMLRRLAVGLLSELLDRNCPPGSPLSAAPEPDLLKYIFNEESRVLSQSHVWKLKRKRPLRRIPKNMRDNLPRSMKKMFTRTIAGKLTPAQWQIAAGNRIALAIGGTKGSGLPDHLWPVAAQIAWNDPNFKLDIALKINQWLRNIQVLAPYQIPMAELSANTFWVLIALAKVKSVSAGQWVSAKERARVRIGKQLQEEAAVQAMTNEWADFWDQWIIRLTTQRWPDGYKQLNTRLCKALIALPLMNLPTGSGLCSNKHPGKPFQKLVGKWFDKLDGIKRLKRSSKDFRRVVLLNLSAPHWELQMPEYFRTTIEKETEYV
ncbi:MAG: hypothetical protein GY940_08835 [bacterium]|nr:hypothetical protein [bacterium]